MSVWNMYVAYINFVKLFSGPKFSQIALLTPAKCLHAIKNPSLTPLYLFSSNKLKSNIK